MFLSKTDFSSYLSICLWYLHVFSMQWYFLIFSYYLTVLNGCSLTALKSIEFTLCSGSFEWGGGSICLWYLHVCSMHCYFLISSYYLTVLNGHSLPALKSVEVTQHSGSFKWEGGSNGRFTLNLPILSSLAISCFALQKVFSYYIRKT